MTEYLGWLIRMDGMWFAGSIPGNMHFSADMQYAYVFENEELARTTATTVREWNPGKRVTVYTRSVTLGEDK